MILTETQLAIRPEPRCRAARRRARDLRVRRFRREILAAAPELDDPRFGPLVASFTRISILGFDAYEVLRQKGIVDDAGELREGAINLVNRTISVQLKLANALGLAPAAFGKLRNEKPIDLASAMSDESL